MTWQSVNPQDHKTFMDERVDVLRSGTMLEHTPSRSFAAFVEALLLTGPDGVTRPVAFFDLSGEDLRRTDGVLRFMVGVDALIFVVDPLRALPMSHLDPCAASSASPGAATRPSRRCSTGCRAPAPTWAWPRPW